jgi:hypothetical protein
MTPDLLAEWLQNLGEFRTLNKLAPPDAGEIQEWTREWHSWNKKRRTKELADIKTQVIISEESLVAAKNRTN